MRIPRSVPGLAFGLLLAATASSAQVHPILERGFSPESVYQVGDIDAVNLFNGNLSVTLPIGVSYPVGGRLSYQLTLVYNSSFWDRTVERDEGPRNCPRGPGRCEPREMMPTRFANAGIGWRLSLGDLAAPRTRGNPSPSWLYVAPDGSRHAFVDTLHEGDPAHEGIWYTRDSSYMRLRRVEPPWSGGFPWMELEGSDGIERVFHFDGEDWRLSAIRDAFDNHVDITYADGLWTLTDTVGRTQRIYWTTVADRRVVDRVELTAFGDEGPAVYGFAYANAPQGVDIKESCADYRVGVGERLRVPLLTAVTLPDGSQYRMVDSSEGPGYHLSNASGDPGNWVVRRSPTAPEKKVDPVYYGCVPLSGVLRRMIVPTGAVYEWTHGPVRHPNGSGGCTAERDRRLDPVLSTTAGVTHRTVYLGSLDAATWTYDYSIPEDPEVVTVRRTVTSPDGDDTVHHFNTEPCAYDDNGERQGWGGWAYGLPYRPFSDDSPLGPSVEYYEGHGSDRVLKRARHVRYEHDQLPELTYESPCSWYDSNRRLAQSRVIHYDDPVGVLWSLSSSKSTDFDGLGHYRRVEHEGFGAAGIRAEVTRYNAARGTYSIDDDNNPTGSFTMLSPDEPWVLDTYDQSWQTEGAVTAKQELCFDPDTGLLERRRTLKSGTVRAPHDLLTAYHHDGRGDLVAEHFHGGDRQSIGTGAVCKVSLPLPESGLEHEYDHGARSRTTHLGTSVHVLDVDIDPGTGLVARTRDVSGVGMDWFYDALGRVTTLAPDQGARVQVRHVAAVGDAASGLTPPRVEVHYRGGSGSTLLAAETFEFDAVGRISSQSRLLPDDTWGTRYTQYTKGGRTERVSEWTGEGVKPVWTVYSDHDAFGRARRVTTPDGRSTDLTFIGERVATRTVSVATGGTGATVVETPVTTTAHLDYRGRVTDVWEPIDSTTEIHSRYEHDIGGRLSVVTVEAPEGTQTREWRYDNRGLLQWQRLPEKGTTGNGMVTFGDYDARGNAWSVVDGPNHLAYTWDAANRLIHIDEADGARRPLEERTYGDDNSGTNRRLGKLVRAVRHNYFDGVRDFRVEERYEYRGLAGRVSARTTQVGVVGENRERAFDQGFTWTELGALASQSYPRHLFTAPPRSVQYQYANGFLTAISGAASQITYHPNGMVRRTVHENGVVDEQLLDASGMARPRAIRTVGALDDWGSGTYLYDGAGHVARIGGDWFRYDRLGRVETGTARRADGTLGRQTYRYDGFGNVLETWTSGVGSRYAKIAPTTNRLSTASYDAAGNQTTWGSGPLQYQYTHSPFNQIHLVSGGSPPVTRFYGYTADGERVAAYASDTDVITHTFRDLEGRVVREYGQVSLDGSWSWKGDYIWGPRGLLVSTDETDTRVHQHVDHLGSPRLATARDGSVVARHHYYPFGEEATDPFAEPTRIKFTGHERDLNLESQTTDDLDYMHARFFNPNLGRFLSVDPLLGTKGTSQSWNGYQYVLGKTLNLVDPRGLSGREPRGAMATFHGEITVEGLPVFYGETTVTANALTGRDLEMFLFRLEAARRFQRNVQGSRVYGDPRREMLRILGGEAPVLFNDLPSAEPSLCGLTYGDRWRIHFTATNGVVPGILAPTGLTGLLGLAGYNTPAAAAGLPAPLAWLMKGGPGVISGGVQFTRVESAALAAQSGLVNFVATGLAYEAGVAVGAAVNAAIMPCSETYLVGY